jgi:hypothetical protein
MAHFGIPDAESFAEGAKLTLSSKLGFIYAFWILSGITVGTMALHNRPGFWVLLVILLLVVRGMLLTLRCPKCGHKVLHTPFGYTGWIPENCSKCRNKLRG